MLAKLPKMKQVVRNANNNCELCDDDSSVTRLDENLDQPVQGEESENFKPSNDHFWGLQIRELVIIL